MTKTAPANDNFNLQKWTAAFVASQQRLGEEFEKILEENFWELLVHT